MGSLSNVSPVHLIPGVDATDVATECLEQIGKIQRQAVLVAALVADEDASVGQDVGNRLGDTGVCHRRITLTASVLVHDQARAVHAAIGREPRGVGHYGVKWNAVVKVLEPGAAGDREPGSAD